MVNKVILVGNLGKDPDVKHTQSGTAVATLSVATTMKAKDKEGKYQDSTEWHRVIVWDKSAEFCGNYLQKGAKVYIEGRLQTRKWKSQSGQDQYATEIVAATVQNLTTRDSQGGAPVDPGFGGTGEDVPF